MKARPVERIRPQHMPVLLQMHEAARAAVDALAARIAPAIHMPTLNVCEPTKLAVLEGIVWRIVAVNDRPCRHESAAQCQPQFGGRGRLAFILSVDTVGDDHLGGSALLI